MALENVDGKVRIGTELDDSGVMQGMSKLGGTIGKGFGLVAKGITATTTAVTAFGVTSVKQGMAFDQTMSQVAATMGYTTDQLADATSEEAQNFERLRKTAQELGETTKFTASESASALNYMALAGYDVETAMETVPSVLNLAAAGNMDLAKSSDMVTDALSALGKGSDYAETLVDQMAKTASKSNTNVEQLGEAILTVGGTAKELAGGTAELNAVLGSLANAGIKGAEGGTKLRNVLLKLSDPTKEGAKWMEKLGVSAFDADGNMRPLNETMADFNTALGGLTQEERLKAISNIFNTRDVAAVSALMAASAESTEDMAVALSIAGLDVKEFNIGEKELAKIMDDVNKGAFGEGEVAVSKFSETMKKQFGLSDEQAKLLFDTISAGASDFDQLEAAIRDSQGAAQDMADTQMDNLAGDVTRLKSAFEGLQIAISDNLTDGLRPLVREGTSLIGQLTDAVKTGDFEQISTTIGSILDQIIQKLVEMLPQILNISQSIIQTLLEGLQNIDPATLANVVMTLADAILGSAGTLVETGIILLTNLLEGFASADGGTQITDAIYQIVTSIIVILTDNAPTLLSAAVDIILSIAQAMVDNVPILWSATIQLFTAIVSALPDIIVQIIEALPELITGIVDGLMGAIPQLIQAGILLFTAIVDALPEIINAIVQVLPELIEGIINGLTEAMPLLIDAGVELFSAIVGNLPLIGANIVACIPTIILTILEALTKSIPQLILAGVQLFGGLAEAIPKSLSHLKAALPKIMETISSTINSWKSKFTNIGKNIIEGIANGFSGAFNYIKQKALSICRDVKDTITGFFKINSPSKVMRDDVGQWLAKGIGVGFDKYYPEKQIVSTLDNSMDTIQSELDGMSADLNIQAAQATLLASDKDLINYESMAEVLGNAMQKVGIYMDSKICGKLVAPSVNTQFGVLNARRV